MLRDKGKGWAAMMKMGPNNAEHVIWALGVFSFLFSWFFLVSSYVGWHKGGMMGSYNENGPKQGWIRCLHPRCIFLFHFLHVVLIFVSYFTSRLSQSLATCFDPWLCSSTPKLPAFNPYKPIPHHGPPFQAFLTPYHLPCHVHPWSPLSGRPTMANKGPQMPTNTDEAQQTLTQANCT